jgi:hypothetical protein
MIESKEQGFKTAFCNRNISESEKADAGAAEVCETASPYIYKSK